MGDPVSENNDFDSRYFDDRGEAPSQAAGIGFDETTTDFARDVDKTVEIEPNSQLPPARPGGWHADDEQPQFQWPDADADPAAGVPGQRVPVPDRYWGAPPQSPGGRHGHNADMPPGSPGPAPASPAQTWGYDEHAGAQGRYMPREAPPAGPPSGPPSTNGAAFRAAPQQRSAAPGYPPPVPGYPGGGGAPGYPPRRPDASPSFEEPSAGERARGVHRPPADRNEASVGDLRAQIRESHVAPPYKPVPKMGWRSRLYRATRINVGLSAEERHWNDLARRLKVNLRGNYVIAVFGEKGGVTKTTTTISLGMALKQYRDEKIVAIDANPASGNLDRRILEPSTLSWRGFINDQGLRHYSDYRQYMGKDTETGLDVLASDRGDEMMTGADLVKAWTLLQVQYPIAIIDCGNQMRDDITKAILDDLPVDAIVVPSTTRLDGAKGAADTLNWLMEHGYPHLVRQAVVVVSNINKIKASDQVRGLHEDFEKAVHAVHDVPFDPHLSDATAIEFWRMRPETQKAYIEAAASLVDGFAGAADRKAVDPSSGWGERGALQ